MPSQTVTIRGHIIDSLILPKILDEIMDASGSFKIEHIRIGQKKTDTSTAQVKVSANTAPHLANIIRRISKIGAVPVAEEDAKLEPAPRHGVFPEDFYCTTNLITWVHFEGRWIPVRNIEMDCGIVIQKGKAWCTPVGKVRRGERVVCGHAGVKVIPLERSRKSETFQFMTSSISSEKPKGRIIRGLAREIREVRRRGGKILVVAGPAVVHTGAGRYLEQMIRMGYVQVLFAGNGLATHDMEYALFGTSLGVNLDKGEPEKYGHDHHMRAINAIRAAGGIRRAVRKGLLKKGIMHACVQKGVQVVLAGSVRDDGPLPDVITDVIEAQDAMRKKIKGVSLALMIASTLHSIATGNMLPATVRTICVDINPAVVTKVADRGTFQILGLVTDTESFLRELCHALNRR
ncbi:MAG: TIGR00300 family protein [Candidatus Omnitrophica bacterium]|nr:TIGR00300 family protein [Candidatus Omnitrophota bacterium]